jgi:hypothetical protein
VRIATQDHAIKELKLRWTGKDFVVPASELASVPNPQLDTLRVLLGQYHGGIHDDAPYLIIQLRFGQPSLGENPRAHFLFYSGAYRRLRITTRTSETRWQDTVKLPGKKATAGGTTTLLLPDTIEATAPSEETSATKSD